MTKIRFPNNKYVVEKMARKKAVKRKKAAAKKVNPTVALKARLADLNAQVKSVTTETKEVAKRTDAFIKANLSTPAKPAPAAKKKAAKKRPKARRKAKK